MQIEDLDARWHALGGSMATDHPTLAAASRGGTVAPASTATGEEGRGEHGYTTPGSARGGRVRNASGRSTAFGSFCSGVSRAIQVCREKTVSSSCESSLATFSNWAGALQSFSPIGGCKTLTTTYRDILPSYQCCVIMRLGNPPLWVVCVWVYW